MNGTVKTLPRLLVVDDEEGICNIVRFIAEGAGYDVVSTTNPEQFGLLYSNTLDVIVLDLSMPGFDGIELIRFLADNRSKAAIVLMSGLGRGILHSAEHLALSRGLRVISALQKPIAMDAFETVLRAASNPQQAHPSGVLNEAPTPDELITAISQKEITVFYQPRVDIKTRALAGVEALARWRHPEKGMIPPAVFIPIAEQNDLINDLTKFVMSEALDQCGKWKASGNDIQVSINFSMRMLTDLEFPDDLQALSRSHGLDPSQVVVEITESSVMENLAQSLDILTRLRLIGFQLSIDDFGTGYSSMQQLQRVAFSELKVDQSFVRHMDTDNENRVIVESIIALGKKLGLTVVAEGIETQAVWDVLVELGCDQAQGYFMGRPMPGPDLEAWLEEWNKTRSLDAVGPNTSERFPPAVERWGGCRPHF